MFLLLFPSFFFGRCIDRDSVTENDKKWEESRILQKKVTCKAYIRKVIVPLWNERYLRMKLDLQFLESDQRTNKWCRNTASTPLKRDASSNRTLVHHREKTTILATQAGKSEVFKIHTSRHARAHTHNDISKLLWKLTVTKVVRHTLVHF